MTNIPNEKKCEFFDYFYNKMIYCDIILKNIHGDYHTKYNNGDEEVIRYVRALKTDVMDSSCNKLTEILIENSKNKGEV